MVVLSQSTLSALAFQGLIVLLILRRSYQMARGTTASTARLLLLPLFLLLIFGLAEYEATVWVPWTFPAFTALDVGVVILGTILFGRLAERRVEVEPGPGGEPVFRVALPIAIVYVLLFVARLGVELAYFPALVSFGPSPTGAGLPPFNSQVALVVIDLLFALSTGLLTGRTIGVFRRLREFRERTPPSPATTG